MTTPTSRTACLLAVVAALSSLSGCGEGGSYPLANVAGRITKSGKPVPDANIYFQPIASEGLNAGPSSYGMTDADGRYELRTTKEKTSGAVIGRHRVTVHLPAPTVPEEQVIPETMLSPRRFRDGSTQIEVPAEGTQTADFSLE